MFLSYPVPCTHICSSCTFPFASSPPSLPGPDQLSQPTCSGPWAARVVGHSTPWQRLDCCGSRRKLLLVALLLPKGPVEFCCLGRSPQAGMFQGPCCALQHWDTAHSPAEKQHYRHEEGLCWACFRRFSVTNPGCSLKPSITCL